MYPRSTPGPGNAPPLVLAALVLAALARGGAGTSSDGRCCSGCTVRRVGTHRPVVSVACILSTTPGTGRHRVELLAQAYTRHAVWLQPNGVAGGPRTSYSCQDKLHTPFHDHPIRSLVHVRPRLYTRR